MKELVSMSNTCSYLMFLHLLQQTNLWFIEFMAKAIIISAIIRIADSVKNSYNKPFIFPTEIHEFILKRNSLHHKFHNVIASIANLSQHSETSDKGHSKRGHKGQAESTRLVCTK